MRVRLASCSANIALPASSVGSPSSMMTRILRGALGLAGLGWICIASSLCGCNSMNGYVMNESGKAYYKRGDYAAARHEFERALMDSPENPHYAYNVAAAMQQQGDVIAAEKMYQHALVIDPGHEPSYEGLAHLLNNNGRTTEAEQLLTAWAETQPYDEKAGLSLARMEENLGNTEAADAAYDRAMAANPHSSHLANAASNHYRRAGRRRDAAMAYRGMPQNSYHNGYSADPEYASQSPALLMAQQMPQFDPTFQPAPMPMAYPPQSPVAPTAAPYIGTSGLAQSSPSIYRGTYTPLSGSALSAAPWGFGTAATVPNPVAGAYHPPANQFYSGMPAQSWAAPVAQTPVMAPTMVSPVSNAVPMMSAQPMTVQPMSYQMPAAAPMGGQPMVVPAF